MTSIAYGWLVCQALFELVRFDLMHALGGFATVERRLAQQRAARAAAAASSETRIVDAVVLACCLYWKPVFCLQRSVCVVRLLRRHGVAARLIIGYRPVPFFSHAWADVDGRVVNDSPEYPRQLQILRTV